jgi:hypothetical protein
MRIASGVVFFANTLANTLHVMYTESIGIMIEKLKNNNIFRIEFSILSYFKKVFRLQKNPLVRQEVFF